MDKMHQSPSDCVNLPDYFVVDRSELPSAQNDSMLYLSDSPLYQTLFGTSTPAFNTPSNYLSPSL